ncbi:hypothetical protein DBR17_04620 [Sphingomonas sp. HMWF008]|nr:hypothetical protein DBR17_04620 [Sphingomonas sp. HMWF008]
MYAGKGVTFPLPSLGLGGDGDEVAAILQIEREFGVSLDYADAQEWHTVGDVYAALLRALGAEPVGAWRRFSRLIANETGVDPQRIGPETELLGPGFSVLDMLKSGASWLGQRAVRRRA